MGNQPTFVNKESGAQATVERVTDRYADIAVRSKEGKLSRFSMPIAEYDGTSPDETRHFASLWRPATPDDLAAAPRPETRYPANMVEREDAEGVQISPELD